jgi:hypothetical protein
MKIEFNQMNCSLDVAPEPYNHHHKAVSEGAPWSDWFGSQGMSHLGLLHTLFHWDIQIFLCYLYLFSSVPI